MNTTRCKTITVQWISTQGTFVIIISCVLVIMARVWITCLKVRFVQGLLRNIGKFRNRLKALWHKWFILSMTVLICSQVDVCWCLISDLIWTQTMWCSSSTLANMIMRCKDLPKVKHKECCSLVIVCFYQHKRFFYVLCTEIVRSVVRRKCIPMNYYIYM